MDEFASPEAVSIEATDNIVAALFERDERESNRAIAAYRGGDGDFVDVTVAEFCAEVRALAAGMVAHGLEAGDRVCVLSPTCIEFAQLDYAIWAAGGIPVAIYETSSREQIDWITSDSGAALVFTKTADLATLVDMDTDRIFVIDEGGLDQLKEHASPEHVAVVDERTAAISHDDTATLSYTSGTTGNPKGCELTHGNLIFEVRQVRAPMPELFVAGASTLIFLPLSHIFARVVQIAAISCGVKVGYSRGISEMTTELGLFKPTFLFAVPRVFEKIYAATETKAGEGIKQKLFARAADTAVAYSEGMAAGRSPSVPMRAEMALYEKLIYSKLKDVLGGRLTHAISGGGPLSPRLGHFFNGIGVTVLEGYGLTETAAAVSVNTPNHMRIGSVGRPVPGNTIRIAESGEILAKGDNIMRGYWNNPEATAEVFDEDGWFRTGDIGELSSDGFLTITGRIKDILVTSAGKNVAPAVLENRIANHRLVGQAVVIGDNKPFIAALIGIDEDELVAWADQHDKRPSGDMTLVESLLADDQLLAEVETAIEDANAAVSRAESIREWRILPAPMSIETGELTPTLKVKRPVVQERHAGLISEIYD